MIVGEEVRDLRGGFIGYDDLLGERRLASI